MTTIWTFALAFWMFWFPQLVVRVPGPGGAVASGGGSTPGFVSETSKNSTLSTYNGSGTALGTNPTGQTACPAYSFCIPFAEGALSGNLGIVGYTYANSTAVTPTASDDKSDSWTCVNGSKDSGTGIWAGACDFPNLTAGAHKVTITFGTTTVTNVQAKASMAYNVAASSPLDVSGSAAGASSATANAVTISPTVANDYIWLLVCRTGTPAVTGTPAFAPGSGFTLGTEEDRDGCASEWEVDSGTGSLTPSMTMANASTYTEIVLAFKASSGTQGSAPSGVYLAHLRSYSTPASSSVTSWPLQFTSSGNLLVAYATCGGAPMEFTAMADSGNAWKQAGTINVAGASTEFYVQNAAADANGSLTMTTTGTGDCNWFLEDYSGFPSIAYTNRLAGVISGPAAGSPLTFTSTWLPWSTAGLTVVNGSLSYNTALTMAAPSGAYFDGASFGGMALDGPEPIDQNNPQDHYYFNGTGNQTVSQNLSSSSEAVGQLAYDLLNFLSPSGIGVINSVACVGTSSATLTCTVPATSGSLLVVAPSNFNSTARTVSKVCLDGTTCAAGNSFTQFSGAAAAGSSSVPATDIWYLANPNTGKTTVTITFSASASNTEVTYWELVKGTGTSWATDGTTPVHLGSVSSSTASGGSVTTTGSADFCAATFGVSGTVSAAPLSGNEFIYPNAGASGYSDGAGASVSLLTTSATAHQPKIGVNSGTFNSSTGCFK